MITRITSENDKAFQTAVFGLRLPCTPKGIWTLISPDHTAAQAVSDVQEALTTVWVLQVMSAFRTIWQWRHSHLSDGRWHADKAAGIARAAFAAAIHRVRRDVDRAHGRCVAGAALAAVSSIFSTPAPPRAPATDARYVLFFDGGSRGNPGPGGAGSVILRTDATASTATLIWSAAMSLADRTTTNNQAEYVGLLTGLQATLQQDWSPLAVVGDSSLVLRQMSEYRRPLNARLLALYGKARLLADRIGVTSWTHHLRAWNKMADAAANVAMDCQRSLQTFHPSDRPEWRNLDALLPGDFAQWRTAT